MLGIMQVSYALRKPLKRNASGLHGGPWSISTTEVICFRMRSLQSVLACYNFFWKNSIRVTDEALFLVYCRLFRAAPLQYESLLQSGLNSLAKQLLDVKDYACFISQGNSGPLLPLIFLLQTTQQQSTLRPIYHRLNGVILMGSLRKPMPVVCVALSILSTPSAILNISLYHNLSKRRWDDALRTIYHCQKYDLLGLYVQTLGESRLAYSKSLPLFCNDPYYSICLKSPSLVPLMNALLIQWETYWDTLKEVTKTEQTLKDGIRPLKTLSMGVDDEVEFEPCPDNSLTDIPMRCKLEENSLDVLSFAAHIYFFESLSLDNQVEEQEVYHRLTEATTRLADYAFCRRLVGIWSAANSVSIALNEDVPNTRVPLSETRQLVLMRLLERAPSHDSVLQDLDQSTSCLALLGPGARVSQTLHCPEVLSVLSSRLLPSVFFHEVVEKRLMYDEVLLSRCVQEVVRSALEKGGLYEAVSSFWIRQAHLELALLCESQENSALENDCESVLEGYLSQIISTHERVQFLSTLLRGLDKQRCTFFVELICTRTKNQGTLLLLIQVMSAWIKEYHCPGDAAVLLYHITQTELTNLSKNLSTAIVQETVASFFDSVAQLGFLLTDQGNDKIGGGELAAQWLKMLSEVPPRLFSEPTLVVWCFWTMRALVQWEEKQNITTLNDETVTVKVLNAVRNLCLAMESCKADAVLPPMLLNWLVSRTRMSWAEATGWIVRNAGVEASERRRFLFIRLPLRHAAFETFADPQHEKQTLLVVERELKQNASFIYNCYNNLKYNGKRNEDNGENIQDEFNDLYKAIRVTLLRAWYNYTTSMVDIPDKNAPCSFSALPLAYPRSRRSLQKMDSAYTIFSLKETFRTLWEETSQQNHTDIENTSHNS